MLIKTQKTMNNQPNPNLRLITIAISHYCEKVRWALDWLNIPYVEESHAPPFHRFYTSRYGGTTLPVLITDNKTLTDSTDILHYLDSIASADKKLYPIEPELRHEVEELEELFDTKFGVATRHWAYFYRIQQPELISQVWRIRVPWREKVGCAIAFPVMIGLLKRGYNITEEQAAISLQTIRDIFAVVNKRLESGQQYLVGNSLSAADITFAALAAPVLYPKHHPIYPPQAQKPPQEMLTIIKELRKTLAGAFVARLYRELRIS